MTATALSWIAREAGVVWRYATSGSSVTRYDPRATYLDRDASRGRFDGRDRERHSAEVVATRALGFASFADRQGKLGQRAPAVDAHVRHANGFGSPIQRPHNDLVVERAVVIPGRPGDLATLELHAPLAGPRGDRSCADPAAAVADDDVPEVDRGDPGRRPRKGAPPRIPGFAVDPVGLTLQEHPQQVEVVDRHVDEQRLLVGVMARPAVGAAGRVAAKV